jgi:4-amino-4-deoxy-L-arabinose transferase-like glycosyltransferase
MNTGMDRLDASLSKRIIENCNVRHRGGIVLILFVFFVSLAPVLPHLSTYHGDEQFYTDSAVYMVQHSDFLNPHYADGTLRTRKPIVTYWVLMASYAALGINFFAARLPFLLAGMATVWVTYLFSLKLFQQRRIAVLAVAILISNVQFVMLNLRATPDILQTLFMISSLYGFCSLVFNEDYRLRNYLLAYIGAALAIQTKGLLGVVLIGFMFLYLIVAKEKASTLRRILHWPVITAAVAIALSWYVYIYFQHGGEALWRFFDDQVAGKIDTSRFYILLNLKDYIGGAFRHFIPWSLIGLVGYLTGMKTIHRFIGHHRKQLLFILCWFSLLLAIFAIGAESRTRYMVPAYPLLSILLAALFWEVFDRQGIRRLWNWCCGVILALFGLTGIVLIWIGVVVHWKMILGGGILLGVALWAVFSAVKFKQSPEPIAMGLVMLVAVASVLGYVLPPIDFAPSKRLVSCLLPEVTTGGIASVWSAKRADYLRQIYTVSKGRITVNHYPSGQIPKDLDASAVIVLEHQEREAFDARVYTIQPCGTVFRDPEIQIVWQGLISFDKDLVMAAIQEPLYLARRKT